MALVVNSGGKYLGSVAVGMYRAESKDESQIAMKREDTCLLDEELTKRVTAATASDMQLEDTFYGADVNLKRGKEAEYSGSKRAHGAPGYHAL